MNIFYLDESPHTAARMQCDKHVVKMILESAQMLCTAHRVLDDIPNDSPSVLYRKTHTNHPSSVWVREGHANYYWLLQHFYALCKEYTFRYDRTHLTETKLAGLLWNMPLNIPDGSTPIKLAMPDEFKSDDPVKSYRDYYKSKDIVMKWTKREAPEWYVES